MYEFHQNKSRYFEITNWVTSNYVIPFIKIDASIKLKVCEIGCGEAGVLKAFLDLGHHGTGIELMEARAIQAKENLANEIEQGRAEVINKNIYDIDPIKEPNMKFDLIVLKDVIEHIPNQEVFVKKIHDILLPKGQVFFGYPPWWMPFGGHQQICQSKILSKLPWVHLLPKSLYKSIIKIFGEPQSIIDELMDIKSTGITIERMHHIITANGFKIVDQKYWLTNPIYVKKFNISPLISRINIPYLRNFYVTAHYVLFERV
jgi:SAM-dependent methyltransferase